MMQITVPARVRGLLRQIGTTASERGLQAYAVGGCVRDWMMGRAATADVDVTVEGDGIGLAQEVAAALQASTKAHPAFGTATLILGAPSRRRRIDFASCRRETYAKPGAYPTVAAGSIEDDLFRRDFTINAMAAAIAPGRFGVLIDPFSGSADLRRRVLRVLHERSFLDDPSRILRGVRFAQRFDFAWEPRTRGLAHSAIAAGALGWLNAGRVSKELERMAEEPDPRACLERLADLLSVSAVRVGDAAER